MSVNKNLKHGEHVARNVAIITFFLAISKFIVAKYTGSVSILADSYHSFSDLIPITAAWAGLKISQRPRNEKFPYGYYKAENLAAFIASIFIFILGYEIIMESIPRLYNSSKVSHTLLGIIITIGFIFVSYTLYRYQIKAAISSNSQALMANARETKMDIYSSILVVIGFSFSSIGFSWVGGIVGIFLAILVMHAGYESIKDATLALMDAGISKNELDKIKTAALSVPRVQEVKNIYGRRSGPFVIVEVEISVPENLNVNQAHMVATEVEKKLLKLTEIDHAIVHVEPPSKHKKILARPVNDKGKISHVFGGAQFFNIYTVDGKNKKIIKTVENPGANLEKKKGVKAALFLIENGIDEVEVINIGEDSKKILEDAGIKVNFIKE